ncbi:predicted protein [Postia placenta Mad-698-R]|nr:predicted protein [Postia placenta Mad-698-R]
MNTCTVHNATCIALGGSAKPTYKWRLPDTFILPLTQTTTRCNFEPTIRYPQGENYSNRTKASDTSTRLYDWLKRIRHTYPEEDLNLTAIPAHHEDAPEDQEDLKGIFSDYSWTVPEDPGSTYLSPESATLGINPMEIPRPQPSTSSGHGHRLVHENGQFVQYSLPQAENPFAILFNYAPYGAQFPAIRPWATPVDLHQAHAAWLSQCFAAHLLHVAPHNVTSAFAPMDNIERIEPRSSGVIEWKGEPRVACNNKQQGSSIRSIMPGFHKSRFGDGPATLLVGQRPNSDRAGQILSTLLEQRCERRGGAFVHERSDARKGQSRAWPPAPGYSRARACELVPDRAASAYDSDLAAARVTGHHQRVIDGVDCCDAKALPNSPRAEVGEAVRMFWSPGGGAGGIAVLIAAVVAYYGGPMCFLGTGGLFGVGSPEL